MAFCIAVRAGPLSAVSVKKGRMLMALALGLVPQDRVHVGVGMGGMGVHVIVADDTDIAVGDDGADTSICARKTSRHP